MTVSVIPSPQQFCQLRHRQGEVNPLLAVPCAEVLNLWMSALDSAKDAIPRTGNPQSSADHLKAIAEAVKAGLGPLQAAKVSYHTPDEFIAELKRLAQEAAKSAKPPVPQESVARGYKVRGHSPTLSAAERKAKEEMAIKLMAEMMKRKA